MLNHLGVSSASFHTLFPFISSIFRLKSIFLWQILYRNKNIIEKVYRNPQAIFRAIPYFPSYNFVHKGVKYDESEFDKRPTGAISWQDQRVADFDNVVQTNAQASSVEHFIRQFSV